MAETLLFTLPAIGSGAGTAVTAGSLFSAVSTAGSIFGQISGGAQQASIARAQSQQYELAARQEELKGREQADSIRRSLQASLSSQRAIFSARGISPNSGSPMRLAGESATAASRDIDIARFGSGQQAGALRTQAAQSRIEGSAGRTAGYTGAAQSLYSLVK